MYCIEADKAGDLWFFTRLAAPKTLGSVEMASKA